MENEKKLSRRILVPLDGSDRSLNTIRFIADFKPFQQMEIVLFNVFHKIPEFYWDLSRDPTLRKSVAGMAAWEAQNRNDIKDFMNKGVALLKASAFKDENITIKISTRKIGIARDIIDEAGRGYFAVATRRRGFTNIPGVLMGSVADKLMMKLSSAPVFFAGRDLPSGKILVAVDNSIDVMNAVAFAADITRGQDMDITLLHVIRQNEEYIYDDSPGNGESVSGEEVMAHVFKKACHKFEQAGVKPENIHRKIISGSRSRAGTIADVALENNHNIIFVGRHGVSKVQDFFLGRVSKKLIYAASKKTVCIV